MAAPKKNSKALGPRVTVLFAAAGRTGKGKTGKTTNNAKYVYMLKSTATKFGFKEVPDAQVKTKKETFLAVRGSKGAGSIKIPVGTGKDQKLVRMPVPAGSTITEIKKFLQQAKSNKPETFYSVNGRSYPVGSSSRAT